MTADPSSSAHANGPDDESGPFVEEDTTCPACGVEILHPAELKDHLAGVDSLRPEYPHQDIEAIAARERYGRWGSAITGRTAW